MKPTVSEISSMARIISADEGMPEMYETSSPDLHRYKILKNYTLKFKVIKNQSLQFTFFFSFFLINVSFYLSMASSTKR